MKCWLCATDHSLILYLCGLETGIQKERNDDPHSRLCFLSMHLYVGGLP